jgi:hypothetical protein
MTFDKKTYMREYMRKRRIGKPTPYSLAKERADCLEEGLMQILDKLAGNTKTLAVELRTIAETALSKEGEEK